MYLVRQISSMDNLIEPTQTAIFIKKKKKSG